MRSLLLLLLCLGTAAQSQKQPATNKQNPQEQVQKSATNQSIPDARQQNTEAVVKQSRPLESQVSANAHNESGRAQGIMEINDSLPVVFTFALAVVGYLQWRTLRSHEKWMRR